MDLPLPLVVEATEEYYRNVYADPDLGPIFKGINMVVLRTHVSYFIHNLTLWDTPMTVNQLKYLTKVHIPVFEKYGVNQMHFDVMLDHLRKAMVQAGADPAQLDGLEQKLKPLRDVFPAAPDVQARIAPSNPDRCQGDKDSKPTQMQKKGEVAEQERLGEQDVAHVPCQADKKKKKSSLKKWFKSLVKKQPP